MGLRSLLLQEVGGILKEERLAQRIRRHVRTQALLLRRKGRAERRGHNRVRLLSCDVGRKRIYVVKASVGEAAEEPR